MAKRSKGKNIKSHGRGRPGMRSTSKPILLFVQGEYIVTLMRLTEKLVAQQCLT